LHRRREVFQTVPQRLAVDVRAAHCLAQGSGLREQVGESQPGILIERLIVRLVDSVR
jgi:hypothetical protein